MTAQREGAMLVITVAGTVAQSSGNGCGRAFRGPFKNRVQQARAARKGLLASQRLLELDRAAAPRFCTTRTA
jgi:transposase